MVDLYYEAGVQAGRNGKYRAYVSRNARQIWRSDKEVRDADEARREANVALYRLERGHEHTDDGQARGYKYLQWKELAVA